MSGWSYGGGGGGGGYSGGSWSYGGESSHKKKKKPKQPDNSWGFGAIGDFVGSHGGHAVGGFVGNLGGDVANTIQQTPNSLIGLAKSATVDAPFPWDSPSTIHHKTQEFNKRVLDPVASSYAHTYGPAFHGNFGETAHRIYQHPLGPITDVLSVASVGGAGALKVAEVGALGRGARALATEPRLMKYMNDGNVLHTEELRSAKTLQGRYRQRLMDQVGAEHPTVPVVGNWRRADRILDQRAHGHTLAYQRTIREYQDVVKGLTPQERLAIPIAAARVDYTKRLDYFRSQLAKTPGSKTLQARVKELEAVDPQILAKPSPQMVRAVKLARDVENLSAEGSYAAGRLTPEIRDQRRLVEQQRMEADKGVTLSHTDLVKREKAALAGTAPSEISTEFGPAFRVPHILRDSKAAAGAFKTAKPKLGKIKDLGVYSKNHGVLQQAGLIAHDPEMFSIDAAEQLRWLHARDIQRDVVVPMSQELNADAHAATMGKPADAYYVRTKGQAIPREIRQRSTALQDAQAILDPQGKNAALETHAGSVVFKDAAGMSIAQMKKQGIRWVPKEVGDAYLSEFKRSNRAMRLFFDRPLDAWRFFVLGLRPAWTVNNAVGNFMLYALHHAGPRGIAAYLRALLTTERGEAKVHKILLWTMRHRGLRRKFASAFEDATPTLHQGGFYNSQGFVRHEGMFATTSQSNLLATIAKGSVKAPVKAPFVVIRGIGRANVRLNQYLENLTRDAAALAESDVSTARLLGLSKKINGANQSLEDFIRSEYKDTRKGELLVDRVSDMLGDFNNLSRGERQVVRRIIPFYSWFKTILTVTGKYVTRYPVRVAMLDRLAQAQGYQDLPSWLQGSIPVGGEKNGQQTYLSTSAINPLNTVVQLGGAGAGLFKPGVPKGTENPGGLLNPIVSAGITALTGKDMFYGGDYFGPGNSPVTRFIGGFGAGLPEATLAQNVAGGKGPIPAKPPSKLYGNSEVDYILNYLGIPVKRVKVKEAKSRAKAGQ